MKKVMSIFMLIFISIIVSGCNSKVDDLIIDKICKTHFNLISETPKITCKKIPANLDMGSNEMVILVPEGFTAGNKYRLYFIDQNYKISEIFNYVVDSEGMLINEKNNQPITKDVFVLGSFMKGESIYYALVSEDLSSCVVTINTPNPMEVAWSNGAHVSISSINADMKLHVMSGKGFLPYETLLIIADNTQGEEGLIQTNELGMFTKILCYNGLDNGGCYNFKISRESSEEEKILEYNYGDAAEKT